MPGSVPWVIVVVRAWLEPDGMRIRLLRNDSADGRAGRTTATPHQAGVAVEHWLEQLRRDSRRNPDAGGDGASIDSPGDHGRNP